MKRLIWLVPLVFLAGCSPVEQQARDALAASQGFIMQAQQNHQAECSQTPKKAFPCAVINQAVHSQNLAVDALEIYCSWGPQDVEALTSGKNVHGCVRVKSLEGGLRTALSNLNRVIADYKAASGE